MDDQTTIRTDVNSESRIIFINDGFFLGGIEVLEIKLARYLSSLCFDVVLFSNNKISDDLGVDDIKVVEHRGLTSLISNLDGIVEAETKKIILASFHPKSAMASMLIAERIRIKYQIDVSVFHWVSHSRAFFFSKNAVSRFILKKTFFSLPIKSCYFMNDAALECHGRNWRKDLFLYPVLRIIGRDSNTVKETCENTGAFRIISVGRLVPFKTYNRIAPKLVHDLVKKGFDISWDIWGYGPDSELIQAEAARYEVTERVKLKGALKHEIFDETVVNYDLFVGMGTAAIEAAKAGVPVIVALENGEDRGYGLLSSTPSDSVGDFVPNHIPERIEKTLTDFLALDRKERESVAELCRRSAIGRESTLVEFARRVVSAEPLRTPSFSDKVRNMMIYSYLVLQELRKRLTAV